MLVKNQCKTSPSLSVARSELTNSFKKAHNIHTYIDKKKNNKIIYFSTQQGFQLFQQYILPRVNELQGQRGVKNRKYQIRDIFEQNIIRVIKSRWM
jgi:hypothetical protein